LSCCSINSLHYTSDCQRHEYLGRGRAAGAARQSRL
jgi:hypothetical protein